MISNENLFNYKVVDLVAAYNFHIYFGRELQLSYILFFPFEVIWKFWKIEIQNLNHVFGAKTTSTEKKNLTTKL